jgi:hypothetical protein
LFHDEGTRRGLSVGGADTRNAHGEPFGIPVSCAIREWAEPATERMRLAGSDGHFVGQEKLRTEQP